MHLIQEQNLKLAVFRLQKKVIMTSMPYSVQQLGLYQGANANKLIFCNKSHYFAWLSVQYIIGAGLQVGVLDFQWKVQGRTECQRGLGSWVFDI